MIKIKDKSLCCGCAACSQVCPKQCIDMTADEEGFIYPNINKELCINCNACEQVCPILNKKETSNQINSCFVAYSKDDNIRNNSSSGGMFSALSIEILKSGGVVFGAAFDEDFEVHHIQINKQEELIKLRGSKYLQSRIEETYVEVKQCLIKGKKTLFSGTPCQIAGLKSFLRKDYSNLFTIDILCHGVPSPKVWKKYLNEQEKKYGAPVQTVSFREKTSGWKICSVELKFLNSKRYRTTIFKDLYMKLFLRNICLRPSCHNCKFKDLERASDITIGDAWGIEYYMPEMDDDHGTSIVLIHSEKGKHLFDSIVEDIFVKEADVNLILNEEADSRKSVAPNKNRKQFFNLINTTSIYKFKRLVQDPFIIRVKRKLHSIIKRKK